MHSEGSRLHYMACEINRRGALILTLTFASCMQGKNSIIGQCNIICTFSVKLVRIQCKSGAFCTQRKCLSDVQRVGQGNEQLNRPFLFHFCLLT